MFEMLSDCLEQVENELLKNKVVLVDDFRGPFNYGGIPYNASKATHVEIATIKGKKTRKYLHIIITRMENGMYENIFYVS